jgi:hypothetical protein
MMIISGAWTSLWALVVSCYAWSLLLFITSISTTSTPMTFSFSSIISIAFMIARGINASCRICNLAQHISIVLVKFRYSSWSIYTSGSRLCIIHVFLKSVCHLGLMLIFSLLLIIITVILLLDQIFWFSLWRSNLVWMSIWFWPTIISILRWRGRGLLVSKWWSLVYIIICLPFNFIWSKFFQISNTWFESLNTLLLTSVATSLALHWWIRDVTHWLV